MGASVLSSLQVANRKAFILSEENDIERSFRNSMIQIDFLHKKQSIRVFNVYIARFNWDKSITEQNIFARTVAQQILFVAEQARKASDNIPTIILGIFNLEPDAQELSPLYDAGFKNSLQQYEYLDTKSILTVENTDVVPIFYKGLDLKSFRLYLKAHGISDRFPVAGVFGLPQ